jgi:hypothetical protein
MDYSIGLRQFNLAGYRTLSSDPVSADGSSKPRALTRCGNDYWSPPKIEGIYDLFRPCLLDLRLV